MRFRFKALRRSSIGGRISFSGGGAFRGCSFSVDSALISGSAGVVKGAGLDGVGSGRVCGFDGGFKGGNGSGGVSGGGI